MKISQEEIKRNIDYRDFLQKRLNSKNFKANVSEEEYEKTKQKYDKVKLKLKLIGVKL